MFNLFFRQQKKILKTLNIFLYRNNGSGSIVERAEEREKEREGERKREREKRKGKRLRERK